MTNQQTGSTQPATASVDVGEGDLEIEITVGDREFDTVDEAEAFVQEQRKRAAVADTREFLEEMWGEDAPDELVDFIAPDGDDAMTFDEIAFDLMDDAPRLTYDSESSAQAMVAVLLSGLSKRLYNNNVKYC